MPNAMAITTANLIPIMRVRPLCPTRTGAPSPPAADRMQRRPGVSSSAAAPKRRGYRTPLGTSIVHTRGSRLGKYLVWQIKPRGGISSSAQRARACGVRQVLTGYIRRDDHVADGQDTASKPQEAFRTRSDGRANDPLQRNRAPGLPGLLHTPIAYGARAVPGLPLPQDCVRTMPPRRADFAPGRLGAVGRLCNLGGEHSCTSWALALATHAAQSWLRAKASNGISTLQVRQRFVVAPAAPPWRARLRAASAFRHALHRKGVPASRMQRTCATAVVSFRCAMEIEAGGRFVVRPTTFAPADALHMR